MTANTTRPTEAPTAKHFKRKERQARLALLAGLLVCAFISYTAHATGVYEGDDATTELLKTVLSGVVVVVMSAPCAAYMYYSHKSCCVSDD